MLQRMSPVVALCDISLQCNDLSLSRAKQTLASGLPGREKAAEPPVIDAKPSAAPISNGLDTDRNQIRSLARRQQRHRHRASPGEKLELSRDQLISRKLVTTLGDVALASRRAWSCSLKLEITEREHLGDHGADYPVDERTLDHAGAVGMPGPDTIERGGKLADCAPFAFEQLAASLDSARPARHRVDRQPRRTPLPAR
jgi:hypothetical protein